MARFHINKNGEPAKCSATTRDCPLGGEHYDSMREAVGASMRPATLLEQELTRITHREQTLEVLRASGMTDEAIAPLGDKFLNASRDEQLAQLDAALKAPAGSYEHSHFYTYKGALAALAPKVAHGEATMPTITPAEFRAYKVARANREQAAFVARILAEDEDDTSQDGWVTDWTSDGENLRPFVMGRGFKSLYD